MVRTQCKKVLKDAKSRYMESAKSRISSQKLGSPLFNGFEVLTSSKDKAELLAQSFSKNCSLNLSGHGLPDFPSHCNDSLCGLRITRQSVAKITSRLDPSTASGPHNIPVIVLQMYSPELSYVLSKLFNKCLVESSFPSCWKCPSVVPVFKNSGERSDPWNYCPISFLPIISKVFESLINGALVSHLKSHGLFSDKQYGFRAARSTADHLTVITERFYCALDQCGKARALDISKTFDKVWHAGLLHKLKLYGIYGRIFRITESFLHGCKIKVILDGQHSSTYSITSGVPQSSILGPILFLIFINDLPDNIISELPIIADDTSLYSSEWKIWFVWVFGASWVSWAWFIFGDWMGLSMVGNLQLC